MALAFTLPDTDGNPTPLHVDGAPAAVVVFTCNHCPYALAWHERIQDVARDYADRGVRVLQISSNDAARYPRDSLEAMRARVQAGEFARPYLYDETQEVARAWGARTTPDVFVTDASGRRLPRRAGRRPRRPVAERGVAARGAGRRAGRAAGGATRDEAGRLLDQVAVELLYWEGCPSHPAVLAQLRAAWGAAESRARDRHRGGRRARGLSGLADDPRRRRRPVPQRRAAVFDVPHLPARRRPLLPHAGPGRAARGADALRRRRVADDVVVAGQAARAAGMWTPGTGSPARGRRGSRRSARRRRAARPDVEPPASSCGRRPSGRTRRARRGRRELERSAIGGRNS